MVTDVHGNVAGLRAVLDDLTRHTFDCLVLGGDYVAHGPRPREALGLARDLGVPAILGNTDVHVYERREPGTAWTADRLSHQDLEWLRALPFSLRFRAIPGDAGTDLLIVHATPTNIEEVLITQEHPLGTFSPTPPEKARALLGDARADLILYGHIHYASQGVLCGQRLASVNSAGFPYDGDHRLAYGIAFWDGEHWQVEHHRLPYDYEAVAAQLDASSCPTSAIIAQRVRTASLDGPAH
jgi:diadenosine tetraphosphatase ApaH/serine/threonine PP2A family protein phosphatase